MLVNERNPDTAPVKFDSEASLREARARYSFERLLQEHGAGGGTGETMKSFKCPFCGRKKKAGLFTAPDGTQLFKCMSSSCPTGSKAMDDVGFLAQHSGQSRGDAFRELLKLAGVWKERARYTPRADRTDDLPAPGQAPAVEDSTPPPLPQADLTEPEAADAPEVPEVSPAPELDPELESPAVDSDTQPVSASHTAGGPDVPSSASVPYSAPSDPGGSSEGKPREDPPEAPPARTALEALRAFYGRLALTGEETERAWQKRGLLPAVVERLGVRSNLRMNRELLEELVGEYGLELLVEAGLYLPERAGRGAKPNPQFFGYGIVRKKAGPERRHKEDKWAWGWAHHPLIPYFDEHGQLIKLRPHKGGAKAHTLAGQQTIYVPRAGGVEAEERFDTVVICEGEFKAMALWQVLGGGRQDGFRPVGVCALPGITFARTIAVRGELDYWLGAVKCRRAIVAFDYEEKPHKPIKERHDAEIWARFLAEDLKRTTAARGLVAHLPAGWCDAGRKSDWDGGLALLTHQGGSPTVELPDDLEVDMADSWEEAKPDPEHDPSRHYGLPPLPQGALGI